MIYFAHAISGQDTPEPPYIEELDRLLREAGIVLFRPWYYNPWNNNETEKPPEIEAVQRVVPAHYTDLARGAIRRIYHRRPLEPDGTHGRPYITCVKSDYTEVEGVDPNLIVNTDLYAISRCVALIIDLSVVSAGAAQEQLSAWANGKMVIGVIPERRHRLSAFSVQHSTMILTQAKLLRCIQGIVQAYDLMPAPDGLLTVHRYD